METRALIVVVDDDESVRESLPDLLRELGFAAKAFVSGPELLASADIGAAKCLILDIGLPGMSGPELQRELSRRGHTIPTIFITGRSDKSIPPGLLDQGGIDCVFKPFSEQDLRDALDAALREN
jgi:FixJ family two-component response regulator